MQTKGFKTTRSRARMTKPERLGLVSLGKPESGKKLGIRGKRRRAGWDSAYLETVLRMG